MPDPRAAWRRFVDWARGPDADRFAPPPGAPHHAPAAPTDAAVRAALALVEDPELGVDLDDLGLLRDWALDGDTLRVRIGLTSAACPVGPQLVEQVRARLAASFPDRPVEVDIAHTAPWSPDAVSPLARVLLGREAWEEPAPDETPLIDLGALHPRDHSDAVVDAFATLPVGASFRLHAPADPQGFADTLTACFPGHFGWTWARRGPRQWWVTVTRVAAS